MNLNLLRATFVLAIMEICFILGYAAWHFHSISAPLTLVSVALIAVVLSYGAHPSTSMERLIVALTSLNLLTLAVYGITRTTWLSANIWPDNHPLVSILAVCVTSLVLAVVAHGVLNRIPSVSTLRKH